ncbi:glycosyltransferase 87 family protein [Candidatus Methylospira mobilis]|uniref:glycosyltransferase 87 family protein n=1 Tax=Candidatus Methylospira mobilis TaxID=1808979 RepID=UPI0028E59A15|nr:glycosyltransferase 87 family protein [Candidatus Methylospira mobilis]WNV05400.1 glycosyltransferase 87 family protein [Candidatus Methylospira mobilis]
MIEKVAAIKGMPSREVIYAGAVALINIAGFIYFILYFMENGYLPSPFIYDKANTFMDLFNPMYWAYDSGRYTEWGSVYPPLSFLILKLSNIALLGAGPDGGPLAMRDNSPFVILGFCFICFATPAIMMHARQWKSVASLDKILIYVAIILSAPMLFSLERGNIVVLCPVLLAAAVSNIGLKRILSIALLINIKPYFAVLMAYFLIRKNFKGFLFCSITSFMVFTATGMVLDENFLNFFTNIIGFGQAKNLFTVGEVMAFPSSVSAFSYVLHDPEGRVYALSYALFDTDLAVSFIETLKWSLIIVSLVAASIKARTMRDAEIIALLVVVITNMGVSVGGYTLLFYIVMIPIFIKMRFAWLYIGIISIMSMPLDIVPLVNMGLGVHYSYLSDSNRYIDWTLGLGSMVRPLVNSMLLLSIAYEVFTRKQLFKPVGAARLVNLPEKKREACQV